MSITGYYDGNSVRTDAKLDINQRVLIIPINDDCFEEESAAGMLHEYANVELIEQEAEAWKEAAINKHGRS